MVLRAEPGAARRRCCSPRRTARSSGTVAMSFLRMSIGGEEVRSGCRSALATDPDFRGRGIFRELAVGERGARARARGPAAADRAERRVGADLRRPPRLAAAAVASAVWARPRLRRRPAGAAPVERFDAAAADRRGRGRRPRAPRRRLAQLALRRLARRRTRCSRGGGYAVGRAPRARSAWSPRSRATCSRDAAAAAGGPAVVAAPPPWQHAALRRAPATCRRSGRSRCSASRSTPALPLPARPHFELGDLDFL